MRQGFIVRVGNVKDEDRTCLIAVHSWVFLSVRGLKILGNPFTLKLMDGPAVSQLS